MRAARVYDVTAPLYAGMPLWPGDPEVIITPLAGANGTGGMMVSAVSLGTHTGTHVDAPRHLYVDGLAVDGISPDILVGPAFLADVPGGGALEPGELLRPELHRTRLLLRRSPVTVQEGDDSGITLSTAAARELVARGVRVVGTESDSIDPPALGAGPAHQILLRAGVVIIEGLRLSGLPVGEYLLVCAPLPLRGADGAPARVFLVQCDSRSREVAGFSASRA